MFLKSIVVLVVVVDLTKKREGLAFSFFYSILAGVVLLKIIVATGVR